MTIGKICKGELPKEFIIARADVDGENRYYFIIRNYKLIHDCIRIDKTIK